MVYLEQSDFNYRLHGVNLMMLRCGHLKETGSCPPEQLQTTDGSLKTFFCSCSVLCTMFQAECQQEFIISLTMVNDFSEELWKGQLA